MPTSVSRAGVGMASPSVAQSSFSQAGNALPSMPASTTDPAITGTPSGQSAIPWMMPSVAGMSIFQQIGLASLLRQGGNYPDWVKPFVNPDASKMPGAGSSLNDWMKYLFGTYTPPTTTPGTTGGSTGASLGTMGGLNPGAGLLGSGGTPQPAFGGRFLEPVGGMGTSPFARPNEGAWSPFAGQGNMLAMFSPHEKNALTGQIGGARGLFG